MRDLISSGLRKLVQSEQRYQRGNRRAQVISVATVKGGVGKTTTAVNLAAAIAERHHRRVLLIDLDAQGHCTTSLEAVIEEDGEAAALHEILLDDERREVLDAVVSTRIDGLDVTGADAGLADAEGRLSQEIGKEKLLADALETTRTHYDVILIDCPPNKGDLTLNALAASDWVLVPTDLSPLAVQGADELLETVVKVRRRLDCELRLLGVVLTRVDGRTSSINEKVRTTIDDAWGELVLDQHIGINTRLSEAQLAGEPIFEHAPDSRGARHYHNLAEQLLGRLDTD